MTQTARVVFNTIGQHALSRFHHSCEHPMQAQEQVLRAVVQGSAGSQFGRRYDFGRIETFRAFQRRVPISEYDALEPYIEAARRGHPAQLTSESPRFYAVTSGTTGPKKYIPVTAASRRAKSRLMRVWLTGLFRDHPAAVDGKILQVISPEVEEYAPDGTPCGAEAGHAYRNMPRVMRSMYPVPYHLYEVADYDARCYAMLRIVVGEQLTIIGTPNPSTILLLARRLGEHTERLLRDVRDGTLSKEDDLPPPLRVGIESGLKPDRERAALLERAASQGDGRLLPRHVWPDLQVLCCWKGGTVGQCLRQLQRYFAPNLPVRDLGWLSSECRGSVPLSDDGDSGPLAVGTNVYEFFPAGVEQKPQPWELLRLDQLEVGGRYDVYVTTLGGLFRYAMHDILEVTGFHRRTPTVRFVQKAKGIVSFTGEKLSETQAIAAAESLLSGRHVDGEFIAAVGQPGVDGENPRYVFLMEYAEPPDPQQAAQSAGELDDALGTLNIEYAAKRRSGRLGPAVLRVLEAGQFDDYQRRALRNGSHDGQFKILRITDDPAFADNFGRVVGEYAAG